MQSASLEWTKHLRQNHQREENKAQIKPNTLKVAADQTTPPRRTLSIMGNSLRNSSAREVSAALSQQLISETHGCGGAYYPGRDGGRCSRAQRCVRGFGGRVSYWGAGKQVVMMERTRKCTTVHLHNNWMKPELADQWYSNNDDNNNNNLFTTMNIQSWITGIATGSHNTWDACVGWTWDHINKLYSSLGDKSVIRGTCCILLTGKATNYYLFHIHNYWESHTNTLIVEEVLMGVYKTLR